mgnify:CR=1 FL=1
MKDIINFQNLEQVKIGKYYEALSPVSTGTKFSISGYIYYYNLYAKEALENLANKSINEKSYVSINEWNNKKDDLLYTIETKNIYNIFFVSKANLGPFVLSDFENEDNELYETYLYVCELLLLKTIIVDIDKNTILCYFYREKSKSYNINDAFFSSLNKTFSNMEEEVKEKVKFLWKKIENNGIKLDITNGSIEYKTILVEK